MTFLPTIGNLIKNCTCKNHAARGYPPNYIEKVPADTRDLWQRYFNDASRAAQRGWRVDYDVKPFSPGPYPQCGQFFEVYPNNNPYRDITGLRIVEDISSPYKLYPLTLWEALDVALYQTYESGCVAGITWVGP